MNSYLYIQIKGSDYHTLLKLNHMGVKVYSTKKSKDGLIVKIIASDYDKITKYISYNNVKKLRYTGPLYFKKTFKKYLFPLLAIICSMILVILSSFFIVDIKVLHNNEQLVDLILDELEKSGVKKFHLAKSFDELQKIKDNIRDSHLDKIDWLEITKVGMKYVVRVEERILNPKEEKKDYCHVYAAKDGVIKSIKIKEGEMKVDLNDFVKKDDLLINGDIHLNEEVVGNVCAEGAVYAEVWYTVTVKVPLNYTVKEKTGKVRNNIVINYDGIDHQLFKDRIDTYESSKKELFNILGVKVYLKQDEQITEKEKKYTTQEAEEKALKEAREKIEITLENDEKVISQKVLQKTINDSTINIDVFVVTEENIAIQKEAELGGTTIP